MRVTIDIDSHNIFKVILCVSKGFILLKRLPKYIRKTGRGYHIVWRGLNISEKQSYIYRKVLGDDPKRIMLDLSIGKIRKQTQILFNRKEIKVYKEGKLVFQTDKSNNKLIDIVNKLR
jgi:hypothetical protein